MKRNTKPMTGWLLAMIAGALLLADAGSVMVGHHPVPISQLFMAAMTLAVGAIVAASTEPRWR